MGPFAGAPLNPSKTSSPIVDEYGATVGAAKLKGDGWRMRHNAVQHVVAGAFEAFQLPRPNAEPFNLFKDLFHQRDLTRLARKGYNHIHGLVPDLQVPMPPMVEPGRLVEIKGITLCKSYYPIKGAKHKRSAAAATSHTRRCHQFRFHICSSLNFALAAPAMHNRSKVRAQDFKSRLWDQ